MTKDDLHKIGVLWIVIITIFGIAGAYFVNQGALADKVNASQKEIYEVVNANNLSITQRVSTVEEAINTLKDDNKDIKGTLKEILLIVKRQNELIQP